LRPLGRARRPPACAANPAFRSARRTRRDRSPNGLICFTKCLQLQEYGALVARDLWIDERRGVVLDAQVRRRGVGRRAMLTRVARPAARVLRAQ
jgi:hypothetical protein